MGSAAPVVEPEVADALAGCRAVVALESTIFSDLGLPAPANREALDRVVAAIRAGGAVPALTAVLDGAIRVGVDVETRDGDRDTICGPARKAAARDIGPAVAGRWPYGATTVSATVQLAAAAGIEVFATGGMGGVHRGAEVTGDVSADLGAIARHRVVTVTAGAKAFLDLPRTVEYLDTLSVPVLGWRTDRFPAFHARSSGVPLPVTVESAGEVAAIARAHWELGGGGLVIAAPVPEDDAVDAAELDLLVGQALADVGPGEPGADGEGTTGVRGAAVTPAVLERLAELSDGRTVAANLALAEHNATVAAEISAALTSIDRLEGG